MLLCTMYSLPFKGSGQVALPVHNIDTGLDYATIQDAIDAAQTSDGHIIRVDAGIYYENVIVNKMVALIGENKLNTIIDGNDVGNVIHVGANNVNISGFTIQNGGPGSNCGIKVGQWNKPLTGNSIRDNIVVNNSYGIYLDHSSDNTISGNNASNNEYGCFFYNSSHTSLFSNKALNNKKGIVLFRASDNNTITSNNVSLNYEYGIFVNCSRANALIGNNISHNGKYGIYVHHSIGNTFADNNIYSNYMYGIYSSDSHINAFVNNSVYSNNDCGLHLYYSRENNVTSNIVSSNNHYEIYLESCSKNTLANNTVHSNNVTDGHCIYLLFLSNENILAGNDVAGGRWPILLEESNNNILTDNNVSLKARAPGIQLESSHNNILSRNTVSGNRAPNSDGILLWYSSNNFLTENNLLNNFRGIHLRGDSKKNFLSSNKASASEVGILVWGTSNNVFLVNRASENKFGILIHQSSYTTFSSNNVSFNEVGILLDEADNNTFSSNNALDNKYGVFLQSSDLNTFSGNHISDNEYGIVLQNSSYYNSFLDNDVSNSFSNGVYLYNSNNNSFLHNDFINNTDQQVFLSVMSYSNEWDNGAEGNHWGRDYVGEDLDGNGIGDTPHVINQTYNVRDNYPLIMPWSHIRVFPVPWGEDIYKVTTFSNSTIASLAFNQTERQIRFKITGPNNIAGFCNVTVPKELLDASSDQWGITVNDETVVADLTENATHTFLYFTLVHSTQIVNIKGTNPIDITDPVANAGLNQTVDLRTTVNLDGSASTDNIGVMNYTWTFIDGAFQILTGVSPAYTFTNLGTYVVTLNVTDLRGNWDIDTVTIMVLDMTRPVADAGLDQTVDEDTMVTFNGSASTDNVGVTNYTWTFADGKVQTLTGVKPTYTFQTPGTYTVTLKVTDAAGNPHTARVTITVLDVTAPTADAGQYQRVYAGIPLSFDASASSDNVKIENYTWTIFDKTLQTRYGQNPSYVFAAPGMYDITLTVTDPTGNWATHTITVTVRAVPVWTQMWFWAIIILAPTTFGLSYLVFRFGRREGIFEQLQKLVRPYVRGEISKEVYEKRLKRIEKKIDVDARTRIKDYLNVIETYERATRAREYIDSRKVKKK